MKSPAFSKSGLYLIFLGLILSACLNLDVDPYDNFDEVGTVDDPARVYDLTGESFRNLHNVIQGDSSVALAMSVMADQVTCWWPDFGMREFSLEPRVTSFPNNTDYSYLFITDNLWRKTYRANGDANYALQKLYSGMDFGPEGENNRLVEAFSWFVNGVAHGYTGLVFDKGAIVRWDSDLNSIVLSPWQYLIEESLKMLDRAIDICEVNQFVVPAEWVAGQIMTNVELAQLASSWAARILIYSARTAAQSDNVDWEKVLSYATNGLDDDFAPVLGDIYGWFDRFSFWAIHAGWGRADLRIMNLMDHDYPSRYPEGGFGPFYFALPGDSRILTDFYRMSDSNFPLIPYMYSPYRFIRYDGVADTEYGESFAKPSFLAWEVRLLEAEALYRTGDSEGALSILNDTDGPRKTRGELPDVMLTDDILRYILDEKEIECYLTGAGVSYFDMRRTDRLQPGTLLHFPVPAGELTLMRLPDYTIHAYTDGIEGSAGGWEGWDK